MKRILTAVLAVSILAACGAEDPKESAEESTEETATHDSVMFGEAPERDEEYFNESSTDVVVEEGATLAEEETLSIIQEAYADRGDVYFGEYSKTIYIFPTDPDIGLIVEYVKDGNTSETWGGIVEEIVGLSAAVNDSLGEGYTVKYMTPISGDYTIIKAKDGALVYDFADDL